MSDTGSAAGYTKAFHGLEQPDDGDVLRSSPRLCIKCKRTDQHENTMKSVKYHGDTLPFHTKSLCVSCNGIIKRHYRGQEDQLQQNLDTVPGFQSQYDSKLALFEVDYRDAHSLDGKRSRTPKGRDYSVPFTSIDAKEKSLFKQEKDFGTFWPDYVAISVHRCGGGADEH